MLYLDSICKICRNSKLYRYMTQKSTQTHDVKVVAILKINIYLYHARFSGESCSTSILCEPELHIINTTTYTPWPRSSAHEHQGWDRSCKVGGICMSEAPTSDWVVTSYPRAVKSQRQKKGGHQSMAPLQGTTAAVYPRSLAGWLAARLFPHTQSCTDRQAGRQEGRVASYLPFPSLQAKSIPWACRHQDANKWTKESKSSSSSRQWWSWWAEGGATGMRERVKLGVWKFRPIFYFLFFYSFQ